MMLHMIELTKSSLKCWQRYSYNGKIEVGPNSTQVTKVTLTTIRRAVMSLL